MKNIFKSGCDFNIWMKVCFLIFICLSLFYCKHSQTVSQSKQHEKIAFAQQDTGFYQEFSWSPDSRSLAVSVMDWGIGPDGFTYQIYLLEANGSKFEALTGGPRDLWSSWSSDGEALYFNSTREENEDIFAYRFADSTVSRVTTDPAEDYHPCVFPFADEVLFISKRSGTTQFYLTKNEEISSLPVNFVTGQIWNPEISPDGNSIVYYETIEPGKDEIKIVSATGGEPMTIAKGFFPTWSPDGSAIIFSSESGLSEVNIESKSIMTLIPGKISYARYSPDEAFLAYIQSEEGYIYLKIRNEKTGKINTLLSRPRPQW